MQRDDGCPTCGSKKFEAVKSDSLNKQILVKCNNCKKFWYSDFQIC